jgi:hypothetical protein
MLAALLGEQDPQAHCLIGCTCLRRKMAGPCGSSPLYPRLRLQDLANKITGESVKHELLTNHELSLNPRLCAC